MIHAATQREVAQTMRQSIESEYPASPQQIGAFAATTSWAQWLEHQVAMVDAEIPPKHREAP